MLEGVEKREPSYTVGGNINWRSHYGEQYGGSLCDLIYDKEVKNIQWGKDSLLNNLYWEKWTTSHKIIRLNPYLKPYRE